MKAPVNTLRLFIEILAAIAVAEVAVNFILPALAPGATGGPEAFLDAAMLGILAGPVILWRVRAAVKKSDRNYIIDVAAAGQLLKLGVVTVLAVGLGLSLAAGWQIRSSIQAEARARFHALAKEGLNDVQRRIDQAEHGLKGARGVYAASKSVERTEFKAYADSRDLPKEFPGGLGFGFIERVMRPDLDAFIARERADEAPDFDVRVWASFPIAIQPTDAAVALAPDLYIYKHIFPLEPNRPSWGFDAGSEPVRREAIKRAIATGQPAITGRIRLLQRSEAQTGFLYLVPVFRNGAQPATPEQRLAALTGLVFMPIVLDAALVDLQETVGQRINLEMFDGTVADKSVQLFDLDDHLANATEAIRAANFAGRMFETEAEIAVGGRTWTAAFSTTPTFEAEVDATTPVFAALGGAMLTMLGAVVMWTMGTSRARALALAKSMTRELREKAVRSERLAEIARRTSNAVIITDAQGRITWTNEAFTKISGYTLEEALGKVPGHLLQCEKTDPKATETMRAAVRGGVGCRVEIMNRGKNGREYVLDIEIMPLHDATGMLTGFMAIESDITEQVATKAYLREVAVRSERLAEIARRTSNAVIITDAQGRITWANEAFTKITGYTLKEALGKVPGHLLRCEKTDPKATETMRAAVCGGVGCRVEIMNRGKNGREYVLDIEILPLHDPTGMLTGFMAVESDITEQVESKATIASSEARLRTINGALLVSSLKQQEVAEKLKEATERFELAVAGTADGVWDWNILTGAVYYAPRFKELLGYSADATDFPALFESFSSRLHPDDLAPTQAAISRAIETDTPYESEYRLRTRDGEWRWFRARGAIQRDLAGRAVRMAGAISDITQARATQEQIKIATALLEEAQTVARMGNWSFDIATGKVLWSKQIFAFFGRCEADGPPDYAGVQSGYYPDDARTHDDAVRACMSAGKPYSLVLRTSGLRATETRYVRGEGRARVDASGKIVALFGTVADVTAEVESREALLQAQAAAEAASRSKSEFLANMSHEIRTPLTAILGFADLLREDGDLGQSPARRIDTIDTIRNAGTHLLTVINDILDISKIEADKMTVERVATPLTIILHEVVSLIRPRAAGKGVTLTASLASPVPDSILSDPTRLRQILMNLAGNAAKFTDAGSVSITASVMPRSNGATLIIDVDDTGAGMTAEQAGRLFQAFSQADNTVTRKHGGTGLGLTICRRLAALMGGEVMLARTEPGRGSCFRVELPLEAAPGAVMVERLDAMVTLAAQAAAAPAATLNGRILLAEDGLDNQRLIAFRLGKAGATVDIADNGRIALEMIDRSEADKKPYDLLLTDMQMPEMDGYTLARTLRDRGSRLAIVALTAHAMAEDRQKCLDSGCDDYATKPIENAKLLTTCADWIGKASNIHVARRAA